MIILLGRLAPEDHFARVICDLRLKLRKPRAMTFAFASADFRGFVNLEAGARASQRVRLAGGFNEDGQRDVNLSQQTWIGPAHGTLLFFCGSTRGRPARCWVQSSTRPNDDSAPSGNHAALEKNRISHRSNRH